MFYSLFCFKGWPLPRCSRAAAQCQETTRKTRLGYVLRQPDTNPASGLNSLVLYSCWTGLLLSGRGAAGGGVVSLRPGPARLNTGWDRSSRAHAHPPYACSQATPLAAAALKSCCPPLLADRAGQTEVGGAFAAAGRAVGRCGQSANHQRVSGQTQPAG